LSSIFLQLSFKIEKWTIFDELKAKKRSIQFGGILRFKVQNWTGAFLRILKIVVGLW